MVDITTLEGAEIGGPEDAMGDNTATCLQVRVVSASRSFSVYENLVASAVCAPPQYAGWIRSWSSEANEDMIIGLLEYRDLPVYALPLEIVTAGSVKIARYAGGTHANGNFAPGSASFLNRITMADMSKLMNAIKRERRDIDLVSLERQLDVLHGFRNPVLKLGADRSPNIALAVDLDGGFDALLSRASGKRKKKKVRSQVRKFEAAGGFRVITAASVDETDRLFDSFVSMKAQQFQKMGLTDVFADPSVQSFYRKLFRTRSSNGSRQFILHGLEVGGAIRAVTGSSLDTDRIVCDFAAFADDELAQASPGEFLFFQNMKHACDTGLKYFDFSVGDERYKRLWQPLEMHQFDTTVPLSARGRILGSAARAKNAVKRAAVDSPRIRKAVKDLRAGIGAAKQRS